MKLYIIDEYFEPVNHCLLALRGTELKDIKSVSSHPQALAQCKSHIEEFGLKAIAKFNTAGSTEEFLSMQDKSYAAIASSLAAKIYNLDILSKYLIKLIIL